MRRCIVKLLTREKVKDSNSTYTKVVKKYIEKEAYFHCFKTVMIEEDTFTIAIVEYDDGTVEEIPLYNFRFKRD